MTGGLLEEPYRKLEGEDLVPDHEAKDHANTAYYTALIYVGFVLVCFGRFIWTTKIRPVAPTDDDDNDDDN